MLNINCLFLFIAAAYNYSLVVSPPSRLIDKYAGTLINLTREFLYWGVAVLLMLAVWLFIFHSGNTSQYNTLYQNNNK